MMHLLHHQHHSPNAGFVFGSIRHFLGLVEHRIELSNLVGVSDPFKKLFNFLSGPQHLEIVLRDSHFGVS